MSGQFSRKTTSQGVVWLLSFLGAVLLCLLAALGFGFYSIHTWMLTKKNIPKPKKPETTVIIVAPKPVAAPQLAYTTPTPAIEEKRPSFTQTSADQASTPPTKNDFIGKRDTTAASDAPAIPGAPNQISQRGRQPRQPDEIETTQNRLQDGALEHDTLAPTPMAPPPQPPAPITPPTPLQPQPDTTPTDPSIDPAIGKEQEKRESQNIKPTPLANGDTMIERTRPQDFPKPTKPDSDVKKDPSPIGKKPEQNPEKARELPKPTSQNPGFRDNREKTILSGSIDRQGKSALNVSKTELGKYQASLSRAVSSQWHRNCAKYRDFIIPGTITVRFVIDGKGDVRSASCIEMVAGGEIQKGFTLEAIREADIPAIPEKLQQELKGEPLELIYNFYF